MHSVAQEEYALLSYLQSEAKKIEAFAGKDLDFPTCPTSLDILEFNQSTNQMVDSILMKEWLLLRKLETVIGIKSKLDATKNEGIHEHEKVSKEGHF